MLFRFCLYGFLKNQRYFEPFLMLAFLNLQLSFFQIGLLFACRDLTVNILEVPSGAVADSFGRRGAMVVSFVSYIVSFLILGSTSGLVWLCAGMVLYGIGDTFRTGTHKAMIFEWLRLNGRSDDKTKIYGITRSWSQIGSAVSGIIAAAFVLVSGSYRFIFYFAIIPYVLNLINFAGYPKELDGDHQKAISISESVSRLKKSLSKSFREPKLRRLVAESMSWEGFFAAIKDYLQPALQLGAIALFANWVTSGGAGDGWLTETRKTALLIGPVYAVLFLISAWASRKAHRLVEWAGGESSASRWLWGGNAILFVALGVASWLGQVWIAVFVFVSLHVLKNVWRPILISRFDSNSESHEGATVLSIESQAQRAATFVFAPLVGMIVDLIRSNGAENQMGVEFWPIGVIGFVLAGLMFVTSRTLPALPTLEDRDSVEVDP